MTCARILLCIVSLIVGDAIGQGGWRDLLKGRTVYSEPTLGETGQIFWSADSNSLSWVWAQNGSPGQEVAVSLLSPQFKMGGVFYLGGLKALVCGAEGADGVLLVVSLVAGAGSRNLVAGTAARYPGRDLIRVAYNAVESRVYGLECGADELVSAVWAGPGAALPGSVSQVSPLSEDGATAALSGLRVVRNGPGVRLFPRPASAAGVRISLVSGVWQHTIEGGQATSGSRIRIDYSQALNTSGMRVLAEETTLFEVREAATQLVVYSGAVVQGQGYADLSFSPPLIAGCRYEVREVATGKVAFPFYVAQRIGNPVQGSSLASECGLFTPGRCRINESHLLVGSKVTLSGPATGALSLPSQLWVSVLPVGGEPATIDIGGGSVALIPNAMIDFVTTVGDGSVRGSGMLYFNVPNDPGLVGMKLCFQSVVTYPSPYEVVASDVFCGVVQAGTVDMLGTRSVQHKPAAALEALRGGNALLVPWSATASSVTKRGAALLKWLELRAKRK
jgi:hypothetical protein